MKITINPQIEFAIVKDSETEKGFFILVDLSEKLNSIILNNFNYISVEQFFDLYDDEEGSVLFAHIIANDIPYTKTGWQDL